MITSRPSRFASARAAAQIATGVSPAMLNTGTLSCSPSTLSCSTAAGRCMSAATSRGFLPSLSRKRASFAQLVVFPEPWRPTIMMPVGPLSAQAISSPSWVIIASSSSWQILMK